MAPGLGPKGKLEDLCVGSFDEILNKWQVFPI